MADDTLRVYPVKDDGYGDPTAYPAGVGYRMVPKEPGATGDRNHELVVYRKPENPGDDETELGRHDMGKVLVVFPGQPSPVAGETPHVRDEASSSTSSKTSAKSSSK